MARSKADFSKVTANIPNEDVLRMSELARHHGTNKTAALVRALRVAYFLDEETRKGNKVFLQDSSGTFRELLIT